MGIPELIRRQTFMDEFILGNAFGFKYKDGTYERIDPKNVKVEMEILITEKLKEFALGRAKVLEQNKNNPRYTRFACSLAITEISNILSFLEKKEEEVKIWKYP